jgi:hypothetical protein
MSLLETESHALADRILDCFPSGTYALSALLRLLDVVETRDVETAAVECRFQPRLLVNPDFGDHGDDLQDMGSADGHLDERSPILFEIVRQIVERWPQPPDPIAGRSLSDLLRNESVQPRPRRSNRAVLRNLFRRMVDVREHSGILPILDENPGEVMTPLPAMDRRSIVLGVLGRPPILHRGELPMPRRVPVGSKVHVYVDVSGSIAGFKGALYGAVLDCRQWIHPAVHLFSERVADVLLAQFRQGVCSTTAGTSIACVADHLRRYQEKRAVILTDGCVGRPTGSDREMLCRVKLGVALTPGDSTRTDLEEVTDYWARLEAPRSK